MSGNGGAVDGAVSSGFGGGSCDTSGRREVGASALLVFAPNGGNALLLGFLSHRPIEMPLVFVGFGVCVGPT